MCALGAPPVQRRPATIHSELYKVDDNVGPFLLVFVHPLPQSRVPHTLSIPYDPPRSRIIKRDGFAQTTAESVLAASSALLSASTIHVTIAENMA